MKKVLNLFVICSVLAFSSVAASGADNAEQQAVNIAKKPEEVHIVKPEKEKKINIKLERKKRLKMPKLKKSLQKKLRVCTKLNSLQLTAR